MNYAIVSRGIVKAVQSEEVDFSTLSPGDSVVVVIPPQVAKVGDRARVRSDGKAVFISVNPNPPTPKPVSIETGEFLLRFTAEERIAIRAAAKQNAAVEDFVELIYIFPTVNLTNSTLLAGLQLLVQAGILTANRFAQIIEP